MTDESWKKLVGKAKKNLTEEDIKEYGIHNSMVKFSYRNVCEKNVHKTRQ